MNALPDHFPQKRLFDSELEDLSDAELLALFLAPGNRPHQALSQAQKIISKLRYLARLQRSTREDLERMGMPRQRALALVAALNLFRRSQQVQLGPGQQYRTSADVYHHLNPRLVHLKKESFWTLLLDSKNCLIRLTRISEGSLTASMAHPREVYRPAIQEAAAGILLAHNHPSGDPEPSQDDIQITRRLVETGRIVGIRVLDHVIIGARGYFSFADQGML